MLCSHRFQITLIAQPVVLVAVFVLLEQQCVGQSSTSDIVVTPVVEEIFSPPTMTELSEIDQPKLRKELLKMISEDQIARRSGT